MATPLVVFLSEQVSAVLKSTRASVIRRLSALLTGRVSHSIRVLVCIPVVFVLPTVNGAHTKGYRSGHKCGGQEVHV